MHSRSNNIKLTSYNADEVVHVLFKLLQPREQGNLKTSIKGIAFIFDLVQLTYYKYHKVNFRRGGSYINSPDCIKKKKVTINLKNIDG